MFKLIRAYQKLDPSASNGLEILFLYPGIKAIICHRLAHRLFLWKIPFLPRIIAEISRWLTGIEIHPGASIGHECVFDHGMGIVIGETAIIGDRVLIYQGVTLGSRKITRLGGKRHPTIEDDVVLGAGCKIIGNITIEKNARVGANSVVLKNVPAGATVVGIPARTISKESSEYKEWELEFYI